MNTTKDVVATQSLDHLVIHELNEDSDSDSSSEEERLKVQKKDVLSMMKTSTDNAPLTNFRKLKPDIKLGRSVTIRQSENNLHQKMKNKFMKKSLNYYGNNSDEETGPRKIGEIYLTVSRLLHETM